MGKQTFFFQSVAGLIKRLLHQDQVGGLGRGKSPENSHIRPRCQRQVLQQCQRSLGMFRAVISQKDFELCFFLFRIHEPPPSISKRQPIVPHQIYCTTSLVRFQGGKTRSEEKRKKQAVWEPPARIHLSIQSASYCC